MRMQKGICIELNDSRSVFMLPNGQFIQGSPAGEAAVGEENYFYPHTRNAWLKWNPVFAPIIAVLAVAALFLSVLIPAQEAFAYVQIEVNPSVELGVDKNYDVISIRPLNSDGRGLIAELEAWENHSLDEILNRVIALSLKESTEEITITTISGNEEEAFLKMVMAVSANVLEKDISVNLKEATKEQWRKSVKESVPVGNLIKESTPVQDFPEIESKIDLPKKQKIEEKEITPPAKDKKKEPAAEEKKKNDPPGQEKRKVTPGQDKKKNDPPGQEKRKVTPGQEKKKNHPPGQEKRKITPGQDKKKNDPPRQEKRKNTPEQDKKKNDFHSKEKNDKARGQEKEKNGHSDRDKKNTAPGKKKKKYDSHHKDKNNGKDKNNRGNGQGNKKNGQHGNKKNER